MSSCLQQKEPHNLFLSHPFWFFCITAAALAVRFVFYPYPSADYVNYLSPWFDQLQQAGGFAAIGEPIGDYMVSYIYILAALTYLPVSSLVSIKAVSTLADIALAVYGMLLAARVTRSEVRARAVYAGLLFLPTILLNSSAWGQCDSIYTAGLLAFLYYALEDRPWRAMIAYSIAFIFKLQAVFLAPFILLMWLKRRVRFQHLLTVPAIYIAVILPAFFAGRPFKNLLEIYTGQTKTYTDLSLGAPNLYAWIGEETIPWLTVVGIAAAGLLSLFTVLWVNRKCGSPSEVLLLKLAFLFVVLVPYLLPRMHERYFYPADAFSVIYFAVERSRPKKLIPIGIELCSFFVVTRYLFLWLWIKAEWFSIPMLLALLFLYKDTADTVKREADSSALPAC